MGFPCGSSGKESARNAGDLGSIPGLGKSVEKGRLCPPEFWPGEFHGLYSPWDRKESDWTEPLSKKPMLTLKTAYLIPYICIQI